MKGMGSDSATRHHKDIEQLKKQQQAKIDGEITELLMGNFCLEESADVKDNLWDLRQQIRQIDDDNENLFNGTPKSYRHQM